MFELSHRVSFKARAARWGAWAYCWAPIVGAYSHVHGVPVPLLDCPFKAWTGIPCPTCGMTRSFLAFAQGNWHQAIAHHLFGPVVFIGFLVAIAHLGVELTTHRKLETFYIRVLNQRRVQFTGLAVFFSYYAVRLLAWSQSGPLFANPLLAPLEPFVSSLY